MSEKKTPQEQFRDDCRSVFGTDVGQAVLGHLIHYFGALSNSYGPDKSAADVAFDEGQRAVVLFLMEQMDERRIDPRKLTEYLHSPYEPSLTEMQDNE